MLLSSTAEAGPLLSLTWSQNLQGISIELTGTETNSDGVMDVGNGTCVDTLSTRVQTSITCPAGLIGASGSSPVAGSFNVSLTMPFFALNTFDTGGVINFNTMATLMGSAAITGNASMAAANQGIDGIVTLRLAIHVAKGANASMLTAGKTTLVKLPLSVGGAGTQQGYFTVSGQAHYVTLDFYGWTPGTRVFTGLTSKFAPLPTPTVSAMGSFMSANGQRTWTLVAPSRISIDGPLAQQRTASFTTLRLSYLPEPSTVLLLGAGAAGLALFGRRS
jgi:hypothetical protein